MSNRSILSIHEYQSKSEKYVISSEHSFQIQQTAPSGQSQLTNNNLMLIDGALFTNTKSSEKIEECSSISPNLDDDTYHNKYDVKDIYDLLSKLLAKINLITSMNNPERNFNSNINEAFTLKLKELLSNFQTSITSQINSKLNSQIYLNELYYIKKHIKHKCTESIKKQLQKQQGIHYCRHVSLSSIHDFLEYYSSLTPLELSDKASFSIDDSVQNVYMSYFGCNYDTAKDNGLILITFLNKMSSMYNISENKKNVQLNITGRIKIVNDEEIIIELGEIIPYLTTCADTKTKTKIVLINKLIFEIIIRQFPFVSQINFFCNIYYAKKAREFTIEANEIYEDNIVFSYINLQ